MIPYNNEIINTNAKDTHVCLYYKGPVKRTASLCFLVSG